MGIHVLVTGGVGYSGSVLYSRLLESAGYRVTVVDKLIYGQQSLLHLCHCALDTTASSASCKGCPVTVTPFSRGT